MLINYTHPLYTLIQNFYSFATMMCADIEKIFLNPVGGSRHAEPHRVFCCLNF